MVTERVGRGLRSLRLPRLAQAGGRQEGDKEVSSALPLLSSHKSLTMNRMESQAQGVWHNLYPAWDGYGQSRQRDTDPP